MDAGRFREFSFHCPIPGRRQTDTSSFHLEKVILDEVIFSKKKKCFSYLVKFVKSSKSAGSGGVDIIIIFL